VTTRLALRTKLNGEIGVTVDAETSPWTTGVRNAAISDGYAALYRVGVWKPATETVSTATETWVYALSAIRRLDRVELLDSSSRVVEMPKAVVEDDAAGGWQLRLASPIATGSTLSVRGWTAYLSTFASDAAEDDLPAEHNRVPLLKAKAILWRAQLGMFARYGERQALPPQMNVSVDQLLGMISAAEREFEEESRRLSNLRPRSGQTRTLD
jgi:hypothetical protein